MLYLEDYLESMAFFYGVPGTQNLFHVFILFLSDSDRASAPGAPRSVYGDAGN